MSDFIIVTVGVLTAVAVSYMLALIANWVNDNAADKAETEEINKRCEFHKYLQDNKYARRYDICTHELDDTLPIRTQTQYFGGTDRKEYRLRFGYCAHCGVRFVKKQELI